MIIADEDARMRVFTHGVFLVGFVEQVLIVVARWAMPQECQNTFSPPARKKPYLVRNNSGIHLLSSSNARFCPTKLFEYLTLFSLPNPT